MSLLDEARRLGTFLNTDGYCPECNLCLCEDHPDPGHDPRCPRRAIPQIIEAMDAADDVAGLLLMVLDNQIRNGWVAEDSPLLVEPRKALERFRSAMFQYP